MRFSKKKGKKGKEDALAWKPLSKMENLIRESIWWQPNNG
jgi:hypothetical protein